MNQYLKYFNIIVFLVLVFSVRFALSHCQIPCGIYDDNMRVKLMLEDVDTIEKSVAEIDGHAKDQDALSQNQRVRWVINKEKHADQIISTISNYFLTQRVKPMQKDYAKRLVHHHDVMLKAVIIKQSVDKAAVESLRKAVKALEVYYPSK